MEKKLKLSVHQLVDFLLRKGDIDNRVFNKSTMAEGNRIHSFYQARQGNNYLSEYFLCEKFIVDDFEIELEGRADGIIVKKGEYIVDEIKSTIVPLEEFFDNQGEWHLGQAKCYALMIAKSFNLNFVGVQLTYIHQLFDEKMSKSFVFSFEELEKYVTLLLKDYLSFYKMIFERINKRNASALSLEFPFSSFRDGQRKLAKYSFGIATNGGVMFAEAPTGIGKTISTLYPFAKSFASEENEKIFYLTAKNSGKDSAFEAAKLLISNGLECSTLIITAKDKICFCPGKACNPDECPYAKDYYSKIRSVLTKELKKNNVFSLAKIIQIASHNAICPFELSLDLSLFVDIIICDYNYLFDPMVYLKRYFDEASPKSIVLVDEAHNLVERGRNMYSASFSLSLFKKAKKAVKNLEHSKIHNAERRISKIFTEYKNFIDGNTLIDSFPQKFINSINAYLLASIDVNKHHHASVNEDFTNFFFELNKFAKLYDYFDNTFALFVSKKGKIDTKINLYCLDPSSHLKRSLNRVKSAVIFSATFSPTEYYMDSIGFKDAPILRLPSPFPKENLHLMIAPNISIKYKDRSSTIETVSDYIKALVDTKVGNYFVYVPSYEYLEALLPYFNNSTFKLIVQQKDMSEEDKEGFLSYFVNNPEQTTLGIAVVGGAFGEGIDLVSDRLIGVIVVGVGLPQLCFERDLIKNYFNKTEQKGFDYAYVNPGMNKVSQAVGRVIRSEKDKGVALLIDNRFLSQPYKDLFKNEWSGYEVVTSKEEIKQQANKFWLNSK